MLPGVAALGGMKEARRDLGAARQAARSSGGYVQLARAVVRSLPDVARLLVGLARDARVPWRYRIALLAIVPYLMSPIDLVPDFLPVIGGMDDAVLVAVLLRRVIRGVDPSVLRSHWHGDEHVLALLVRIADPRAEDRLGERAP